MTTKDIKIEYNNKILQLLSVFTDDEKSKILSYSYMFMRHKLRAETKNTKVEKENNDKNKL